MLALEMAQDEKAQSLGLALQKEKGRRDTAKFKRDGRQLFAIKEKKSSMEEDVMAQVENLEREYDCSE